MTTLNMFVVLPLFVSWISDAFSTNWLGPDLGTMGTLSDPSKKEWMGYLSINVTVIEEYSFSDKRMTEHRNTQPRADQLFINH